MFTSYYALDILITLICIIFLINIVLDIIVKEGKENEKIIEDDGGELSKTSIKIIAVLLCFEATRNLSILIAILIILVLIIFILSSLKLKQAEKIRDKNKIISEKIMKNGVIILSIYITTTVIIIILNFIFK